MPVFGTLLTSAIVWLKRLEMYCSKTLPPISCGNVLDTKNVRTSNGIVQDDHINPKSSLVWKVVVLESSSICMYPTMTMIEKITASPTNSGIHIL